MGDYLVHRSLLKTLFLAAILASLGWVGNTLSLPVAFGVAFIFGSIFSVIALSQLGFWPGLGVAFITSGYTYLL